MSKLCASTLRCAFSIWRDDELVLERVVLLHAEDLHPLGDPVAGEDAHEVVFERQVEAARARVALAAGTAAQLVVDAARLVALGADDVQAAGGDHLARGAASTPRARASRSASVVSGGSACELGLEVAAEHDVGAAAGHVGRDRDGARAAGLRDDVRLALVLLRVQHLVRDAVPSSAAPRGTPRSRSRSCRRARAGRAAWQSLMSSRIASYFAF